MKMHSFSSTIPIYWILTIFILIGARSLHGRVLNTKDTVSLPISTESNIRLAYLNTNNGLSQNHIYEILQDRIGFMWFATADGLNRFDGNTFTVFKNNPNDPESISDNYIQDLLEDKNGCLWIATNNGGLNKFDPTTERFTRYQHDPDNINSPSGDGVQCIAMDRHGYLWFGTEFNGLNKFDPTTNVFTRYPNDCNGKCVGKITDIIEDSQGNIWFVGFRGLFHLNPRTEQITQLAITNDNPSSDYIYEDTVGNLWILAWSPAELIKYTPKSKQTSIYPLDALGVASCNLLDDGNHGFWIPSTQGLYHFHQKTEQFTLLFQHDVTSRECLSDNFISSIYKDKSGLLWLGTENGGINIVNFQQEQFGFHRHLISNPNSLSYGKVSEIYEDPTGILWIGYSPRALDRFDRNTGQITHYFPNRNDKNSLSEGGDINSILRDTQNNIWLGGWDSGLDRFDESSGQFKHYRHEPNNPNSLISNHVIEIYEDKSSNIWLGQRGGLSRFDPSTEQFTNYRPNPNDSTSLKSPDVRVIYQDSFGLLWLGTWGGVLSQLDPKTEIFLNYPPDVRDTNKLYGGAIYAINEDKTGTLWIGTSSGLYRFNREKETFNRYTESKGLPSSSIQGILIDKNNTLWLSTKKGISRFNPRTGTFHNYDISDGLQGNTFSESCYYQSKSGEMFFGGVNGMNAFFPEDIKGNPYIPPVVLTELQLFNIPVTIGKDSPLKKAIHITDQITLMYDQQVFSFKFAALNYHSPEKNQYAYKLEGFDKDWLYTDANNRSATYTRLKPGNYTFIVKASNNDGLWNEQGTSVKINIIPPIWQTWWFRATLILFIAILIFIGVRIKLVRARNKNLELEALVAKRTSQLEIANKEMESFSYSVSHDLRSPLRSIDGFSQILFNQYKGQIDEQGIKYLSHVRSASRRMSHLIDDMLKLSRVSRGELNVGQVNLSLIVNEIANTLRDKTPERKVKFNIQDEIAANADGRLLRIALENLIENAWKYTSKQPKSHIEFGMSRKDEAPVYFVRDDGAGFDMKYAEKLFGAFQRMHDSKEFEGTGIGLATVQRIIHRHGGKIWAESEVGKGATFYFTI